MENLYNNQYCTPASLVDNFEELGVKHGMTLIVHSSLSQIGTVIGGANTVVRALKQSLGELGTLVMPAFNPEVSDPANWLDSNLTEQEIELIRLHLPVYDKETTPTSMGAIPEAFRNFSATKRSNHPQASLIASGINASEILADHPLEWSLGKNSPFEKMYDLDAWVLLIGVGHNRNSSLHYAESLVPNMRTKTRFFPAIMQGQRVWQTAEDVGDDNGLYFPEIGEEYLKSGTLFQGVVGKANCQLLPMREFVDFSADYLNQKLSK